MTGGTQTSVPLYLTVLYFAAFFCLVASHNSPRKTYVVQIDKTEMPKTFSDHLLWYESIVTSSATKATAGKEDSSVDETTWKIIYSFENVFHGFAVHLTEDEANHLEAHTGVISIFNETIYHLHTTRSPQFLGIGIDSGNSVLSAALSENDVIVGVLDTGIWPESPSFSDTGMTPVPTRWKGSCETGRGFSHSNCNRKIVGARIFYRGYEASAGAIDEKSEFKSPRDQDGHGTHTAATVAGAPVPGANLFGYAQGTARGMAPRARIAAYKVCWTGGCFSSDILAAVDQAVADGVDVLSISLGGGVSSYYRDSLSVAAFGAMERGVFIACSAGNGGPDPISLTNVSPWITTVGASTMDRDFPATVRLGNGMNLTGVSLYKGRRNLSSQRRYPLAYMGANQSIPDPRSLCLEGTLDPHAVAGKIVICDRGISPRVQKGEVVKQAGGIGMILTNTAANGEELVADSHLLPAVAVGEIAGKAIKHYSQSATHAVATLTFEGTKVGIRPSPVVAAFSSRGPNFLSLEILKPDMVAPGVNILAAWSGDASPTSLLADPRRVDFNILSGTSMSCPHVGGVAALVKASHPAWTPSSIKSALMTTAYVHDNKMQPLKDSATAAPSTPYDHGAGHIHPVKALDPGLVYDISPDDYFEFLCTQKLTAIQLKVFTRSKNRACKHSLATPGDLNYPAISAVISNADTSTLTLHRTVTNVGPPNSTYRVKVSPPKGAQVFVKPTTLRFSHQNQKLNYSISFRTTAQQSSPEFGALIWYDGTHSVRSPIVITWLPK
ncbi:hypothetical protein HPP92_007097 [Vanilla planifolia]|uniref:Subtilisin-like protease SBT1.3 n=1 Tax=Vanilla planifolia TaxID=51239 RepID=A0A835RFL2_VANPL|nr:hypothetical protein HPP92_007348 [Vanilla planifolia]KAG0490234.1 hypothetical protein HPP92_007097 [Vanilla planifolia]